MSTQPRFWNRIAKRYARQPVADQAAYQHKLDYMKGKLTRDMKLLEIGCGTGSTALTVAPYVDSIVAVDYSPAMIDIAQQKAQSAGISNVDFVVESIDSLDEGASYDAVLAMSVLHLLPDPVAVLNSIYRMTRKGGMFFSSTACIGDMGSPLLKLLPIGGALGLIPKVTRISGEEILKDISGAGFKVEYSWRPAPTKALFVAASKP